MKTRYRFIHFVPTNYLHDYWCKSKGNPHILGQATWMYDWKQSVFYAQSGRPFSADCLRDIADFLERLNKEKK